MILIACVSDCFTRRISTTGYTKLNYLKEMLSKMYPALFLFGFENTNFPLIIAYIMNVIIQLTVTTSICSKCFAFRMFVDYPFINRPVTMADNIQCQVI